MPSQSVSDRYRGLRYREFGRSLCHATPLHHREQNMQVSQLEMTSDAIDPLHGTDLSKQLCNDHISELMYVSTAHSPRVTIERLAACWMSVG